MSINYVMSHSSSNKANTGTISWYGSKAVNSSNPFSKAFNISAAFHYSKGLFFLHFSNGCTAQQTIEREVIGEWVEWLIGVSHLYLQDICRLQDAEEFEWCTIR